MMMPGKVSRGVTKLSEAQNEQVETVNGDSYEQSEEYERHETHTLVTCPPFELDQLFRGRS